MFGLDLAEDGRFAGVQRLADILDPVLGNAEVDRLSDERSGGAAYQPCCDGRAHRST